MFRSKPSSVHPAALPTVAHLDLTQWNKIVQQLDDPIVAHAILEVFESQEGAALREQYQGIYLKLRLTKHIERVSSAQMFRRTENMVALGRSVGRLARACMVGVLAGVQSLRQART